MLRFFYGPSRLLLAVLLLAGSIYGCNKAEDFTEPTDVSAQLGGTLEPGIPTSVQLWGEPSDHVYEGKAGEVISFRATGETPGLDPNVRLFGPGGGEEAFDDDSGGEGAALIQEHVLGAAGTYTFRIQTDEDQSGRVTLLLSRREDTPSAEGMTR